MDCSKHSHDLKFSSTHHSSRQQQVNDDSTCDLSSSTMNTSLGELSVTDLGASLDLNRHSPSRTRPRRELQLRSSNSGRTHNDSFDDSDDNLGESFDCLAESFAMDTTDEMYMFPHSRSQLGVSLSRLGISVSNLEPVVDETEDDCSMTDERDLRPSHHSAAAILHHD